MGRSVLAENIPNPVPEIYLSLVYKTQTPVSTMKVGVIGDIF